MSSNFQYCSTFHKFPSYKRLTSVCSYRTFVTIRTIQKLGWLNNPKYPRFNNQPHQRLKTAILATTLDRTISVTTNNLKISKFHLTQSTLKKSNESSPHSSPTPSPRDHTGQLTHFHVCYRARCTNLAYQTQTCQPHCIIVNNNCDRTVVCEQWRGHGCGLYRGDMARYWLFGGKYIYDAEIYQSLTVDFQRNVRSAIPSYEHHPSIDETFDIGQFEGAYQRQVKQVDWPCHQLNKVEPYRCMRAEQQIC
jgi:hypothetical protein